MAFLPPIGLDDLNEVEALAPFVHHLRDEVQGVLEVGVHQPISQAMHQNERGRQTAVIPVALTNPQDSARTKVER